MFSLITPNAHFLCGQVQPITAAVPKEPVNPVKSRQNKPTAPDLATAPILPIPTCMKVRKSLWAIIWTALQFTLPVSAVGASNMDTCGCDNSEFESSRQLLDLASRIGDIGVADAILVEQGRADWLLIESLTLKLKSQREIPRHCRNRLVQDGTNQAIRFKIDLTSSTRSAPAKPTYAITPRDLLAKYQAMQGFASHFCTLNFRGSQAKDCIQVLSPVIQDLTTSHLEHPRHSDTGLWSQTLNSVSESDERVLRAYDRFLQAGTADESIQLAREGRLGLETSREKQLFLQVLSAQLHDNYDDRRASFGSEASLNPVTDDQLLTAARRGSYLPSEHILDSRLRSESRRDAGVCRDISAYQARIAQALGMRNVYITAYATQDSQHTTISYQLPDRTDSTEIQRQNYERVTYVSQADGGAAATSQSNEVPTHIRIYAPDGEMKTVVTTSLGKVLQEGTGFQRSATDDILKARNRESTIETESSLRGPGDNRHLAKGFFGRTEENTYVIGIGYRFEREPGGNFPTRVGAAIAAIQPDPRLRNDGVSPDTGGMLQLNLEQKVQTDRIDLGPQVNLQIGIHATVDGTVGLFKGEETSWNGQADLRAGSEATLRTQSTDGSFRQKTTVGITAAMGQEDVRDAYLFTPHLTSSYIQATQSLAIAPDLAVFAELTLAHSDLSNRGKLETGLAGARFIASTSISGRLDKDEPLLEDTSIRRVGAQVQFRTSELSNIGVHLEAPIEGKDRLRATQLGAGFRVDF